MVFSSTLFIGMFLPLFLISYFCTSKRKTRNIILLIYSIIFYAWGEPKWIFGMLILTFLDYILALLMVKADSKNKSKIMLILAVISNLAMLFVVKYYDFFVTSFNNLLGTKIPTIDISMPIGISFFTFQALTYVVDVYKNEAKPQKNYFNLLLYISMFPQLIAGPIVRYSDIDEQICNREETKQGFIDGMFRFSVGLGKKVIFANYAGNIATAILETNYNDLTTSGAWIGIFMYTLQLYFDFSGYSDMAIGLGKVCGFDFKENFNYPYISNSIADFWKRWHISLGTFFRDYVYIPMGGNRKHAIFNTLVVWILTGFWHGASWNYMLWGLFFAIALLIERKLKKYGIQTSKIPFTGNIIVILIVIYSMSLFYYVDFNHLVHANLLMAGLTGDAALSMVEKTIVYKYFYIIPFMVIGATPLPAKVGNFIFKRETLIGNIARMCMFAVLFLLCFTLIINQTFNPFLYFRF